MTGIAGTVLEIAGTVLWSLLKLNDMDWTELANKHRRGDGLPKMIREPSPSDVTAQAVTNVLFLR
jgi:hypothetical protein